MNNEIESNAQAVIEHLTATKHRLSVERDDYLSRLRTAEQELLLHRADHNAAKEAGFESVGELLAAYKVLEGKLKAAQEQEPVGEVYKCSETGTGIDVAIYSTIPEGTTKIYASPIPAQQSRAMAVPDEETNFCALKSINDSEVSKVVRAFWRRIYAYRNDYERELPHPLPTEFLAHMATALHWVDREPSPRMTEQDAGSPV